MAAESPNAPASTILPTPRVAPSWREWIALGLFVIGCLWVFGFIDRFGPDNSRRSALHWLYASWNPSTDYEHGKLVPVIIIGLLVVRWREIRQSIGTGSWWGIVGVILGGLLFLAACRTIQPRIALGGLPFLVSGAVWFLYGWRTTVLTAFPIFFLWISIPLPAFQQATTDLQLLATQLAHHGSSLFGVETYTKGTTILPVHGDWKPLSIAHGCSGIRSLMALIMITAAWAYVAPLAMWKRILLFASALPLAIFGNALRVTSIFVIAEYGNAQWASTTWHDWSGLLLFYPISLLVLLAFHSVLQGGLPWRHQNKRRLVHKRVVAANPQPTEDTRP